jgi:hypothetical protein
MGVDIFRNREVYIAEQTTITLLYFLKSYLQFSGYSKPHIKSGMNVAWMGQEKDNNVTLVEKAIC